jgi:hypothetical protein
MTTRKSRGLHTWVLNIYITYFLLLFPTVLTPFYRLSSVNHLKYYKVSEQSDRLNTSGRNFLSLFR